MKSSNPSPTLIIITLALLLGLQSVTTDLYLPALPTITESLGASMEQAQLTLTALLLAFGCSQLVWGPLSDRFGRRPILLWGLGAWGPTCWPVRAARWRRPLTSSSSGAWCRARPWGRG